MLKQMKAQVVAVILMVSRLCRIHTTLSKEYTHSLTVYYTKFEKLQEFVGIHMVLGTDINITLRCKCLIINTFRGLTIDFHLPL